MSNRLGALLLTVGLGASACGGASTTTLYGTPVATAAAPAAASPSAATSAPAGPTSAPSPAGASTAVGIVDYAFNAPDITVSAGTTVTWTNNGQRGHTVTSADGSFKSPGTLVNGQTYSFTFNAAGTFKYVCLIHSSMKGTVTVTTAGY